MIRLRSSFVPIAAISAVVAAAVSGCAASSTTSSPPTAPSSATTPRRSPTPLPAANVTATHVAALARVETSVANARATLGTPPPTATSVFPPTLALLSSPSPDPCASSPNVTLHVAFSATWDGDSDLYVVGLDGQAPVRLTRNDLPDLYPQWSFVTSRLAYLAPDSSGAFQLTLLDPASGFSTPLTFAPLQVATAGRPDPWSPLELVRPADRITTGTRWFSWSPGGHLIAFSAVPPNTLGALYIVDVDDGWVSEVYSYGIDPSIDHTWSPTGGQMAFDVNFEGEYSYFIVELATIPQTSLLRIIPPDYMSDRQPRWDPQGEYLLFLSHLYGSPNTGLFLSLPDGSLRTQLTQDTVDVVEATWSPDGRRIAYQAYQTSQSDPWTVISHELRVATRDAGNDTLLLRDTSEGARQLTWSPDGRFIAYLFGQRSHWDLRAIDICNLRVRALAADVNNDAITWMP